MLLLHGERYIFDTLPWKTGCRNRQLIPSPAGEHGTAQHGTGMLAVDCRPAAEAIQAELHYGSTSVSQTFA